MAGRGVPGKIIAQVTAGVEIILAKSKSCPVLAGTGRCVYQDGYTHYSQN
ncbi:MAG TPA: hypothetical protein VK568_03915 [Thermodesulfobacteriota bacterium]|nr:hypothetical protein [Thermodesulfobacteriota bacterium]